MFDGGPESFVPSEGEGGASEGVSEEARQRFASASAALQQIQREEKKAKKRDDNVAQMILQFLTDAQKTHLATLIARLVSINCPSPFILSILSLINDDCGAAVKEYLKERISEDQTGALPAAITLPEDQLTAGGNERLAAWILNMQRVLATDPQAIIRSLLVDGNNIDGTVLQLTTFVLRDFFALHGKEAQFEDLQQVSVTILQSIFSPYMHHAMMEESTEIPSDQ